MFTHVADQLVEVLAQAGARRMYGVTGDSLNAMTESVRVGEMLAANSGAETADVPWRAMNVRQHTSIPRSSSEHADLERIVNCLARYGSRAVSRQPVIDGDRCS
jgi:hypothetical protein